MISFRLGPAGGQQLSLARTPTYLRVVIDTDGSIDALDQLEDTPEPSERIVVYKLNHSSGMRGFVCGRGGCVPLIDAAYDYLLEQPEDREVRDTEAWRAWCQ